MMRILRLSEFFATAAIVVAGVFAASAQVQPLAEEKPAPSAQRPFKLFQELGLTRDQVEQIRSINQERKPLVNAAQMRWRIANRVLDEAVYADDVSEEKIKELTRVAQVAQSELLKERTITEFRIRQVLSPEQLVKFRALRARLAERVDQRTTKSTPDTTENRPIDRLRQRRNQTKPQ